MSEIDVDLGYEEVPPSAASLIQSMRNLGYTTEAALADLVDNSITAGATRIDIHFEWAGSSSWIGVVDNGIGMDDQALIQAMRPGSRNPLDERDKQDLGRFGLGLKTASFSQAMQLVVYSRDRKDISWHIRCWDLNRIQKTGLWLLGVGAPAGLSDEIGGILPAATGTAAIWTGIDRILGQETNDAISKTRFYQLVDRVRRHLEMVYHRLVGPKRRILINGNDLVPWDPFIEGNAKTEPQPAESLDAGRIGVKAFILPHRNQLSAEEHLRASGPRGWNAHQGFYIYRNKRLLVPGSWLGLNFAKEEHHKLARIRVDLPNNLDQEWQIDLKKSAAIPPGHLHVHLRRIAKATRRKAMEVYRHRGKQMSRQASRDDGIMWRIREMRNGGYRFDINRDHILIRSMREEHPALRTAIDHLIRSIETAIPVEAIVCEAVEHPDRRIDPVELITANDRRDMVRRMFDILCQYGATPRAAWEDLCRTEPFNQMTAELSMLAEELGINFNEQ